ncbi:fluoride efflux transporter CrcB [Stutzerimonas kirkiae]|uniref:Fluoride-specific ion channel FluC n=1 Tax=Stutzerimonas kirkiae TaxID=2211392 RepID=A0A4Q9R6B6_9GAMM|nr:fluoride efflux transporter CrcB [Stutzerimonas kirkiae]TBU96061.1 fluoride efflux transporter CrcB [Stutzerimonas kirkiae]TBV03107.1 fluoride efflux transporter CrcB [Stutzerimonas kirkiae]TBV09809.1 fluoride efflux transporter CrcB [Stutzerimonas kirkiae]TBV13461.1 fluoride efflux transporter CrcB [Stutzerimonas kirkiae]
MIRMLVMIACAGVAGTLLRFAAGVWVAQHWPRQYFLGTLAVNLLGCLLIGYLYAFFLDRPGLSPEWRNTLIVGFVGGLTTFSSFSLDNLRLLESGQLATLFGYLGLSVCGGLLATWLGLTLARL